MGNAYAYIRLAGTDRDGQAHRDAIEEFAARNRIGRISYIVERATLAKDWRKTALGELEGRLGPGDLVVAPSLLMLSRSLAQVCEIIEAFCGKGARIAVLDAGRTIEGGAGEYGRGFRAGLELAAAYERNLVSTRMREALERRGREGGRIGRPPGSGSSALDPFKDRILQAKSEGASNALLAKIYKTSPQNISKWLRKNGPGAFDCVLYSVFADGGGSEPRRLRLPTARAMVEALLAYAAEEGGGPYAEDAVMLAEEEGGGSILIADEALGRAYVMGFGPEALRGLRSLSLTALS